jgi:hypothetical protein
MHCVCGHPERAHVGGGRCRIPDCPCERFEPGDTIANIHPRRDLDTCARAPSLAVEI